MNSSAWALSYQAPWTQTEQRLYTAALLVAVASVGIAQSPDIDHAAEVVCWRRSIGARRMRRIRSVMIYMPPFTTANSPILP